MAVFMEKEKNVIERLLDENDNSTITLYGDNDKPFTFEQVAIVPLNGKVYAILKPAFKVSGVADDEALVMEIQKTSTEESLVIVEDEAIVDSVFAVYYQLVKEQAGNV